MEIKTKFVLIFLLLINVLAFSAYGTDKSRARRSCWRIPEKVLIGLAAAGGSVGAYAGMKVFRHKTKKPVFYIGIPVIFMLQLLILLTFFAK